MKNKRTVVQILSALFTNGYVQGFIQGRIFQGKLKSVCVPGLNCYSCPGALGACPIGALQAVQGSGRFRPSLYVLGLLMLFGLLLGRIICGFLCIFGFVQDLLFKIKTPKLKINKRLDRGARYLKYAVLAVLIFILPLALSQGGTPVSPLFCKYICPSGTLFGAFPLLAANEQLRGLVGPLFFVKLSVLAAILLLSVFIYRPFCKYLCPLGAIYGLFNKVGFFTMSIDKSRCVGCGECERACKMGIEVMKEQNSTECIRCMDCKNACSHGAICAGYRTVHKTEKEKAE